VRLISTGALFSCSSTGLFPSEVSDLACCVLRDQILTHAKLTLCYDHFKMAKAQYEKLFPAENTIPQRAPGGGYMSAFGPLGPIPVLIWVWGCSGVFGFPVSFRPSVFVFEVRPSLHFRLRSSPGSRVLFFGLGSAFYLLADPFVSSARFYRRRRIGCEGELNPGRISMARKFVNHALRWCGGLGFKIARIRTASKPNAQI